VPAVLVLIPVWVGTGLLAPIALGVPLGLAAQAIAGGSPVPAHNGLHGWVYAVVYGGFAVQAVCLLTAFALYARDRAGPPARPSRPAAGPQPGAAHARDYRGAGRSRVRAVNIAWALADRRLAAPPGFHTVAQKALFASTGLLVPAGAWAVLSLVGRRRAVTAPGRLLALLSIAWVGSATGFASGIAGYVLAASASPQPAIPILLALGTASGALIAVR